MRTGNAVHSHRIAHSGNVCCTVRARYSSFGGQGKHDRIIAVPTIENGIYLARPGAHRDDLQLAADKLDIKIKRLVKGKVEIVEKLNDEWKCPLEDIY